MMTLTTPTDSTTAPMGALIRQLDRATRGAVRPADVAAALRPHLGSDGLLAPSHRRSSADGYRTNVVHVHRAGRYSVLALVWRPGQRTPIHSHASWCVVGVHEGAELERSFRGAEHGVLELGRRTMHAGEVAWLDAGDDDIHEVANAAATTTISIHVYGLDYRTAGSSIRHTFEEALAAAA
jgi:3-mercaptopropionate dioxygenase